MSKNSRSSSQRSMLFAAGLAVAASLALAACGSGPSKGDLKDSINEAFQQQKQDCWSITDMHTTFPLRVSGDVSHLDPILVGLRKEGYIQVQAAPTQGFLGLGGPTMLIGLTQSGQAQHVWTPNEGFCIGKKEVDTIGQWTEPANANGGTISTQVDFTWKLDNLPSWAKRDDFATVPGMTTPLKGKAALVKTNKGWSVQDLMTDQDALGLVNALQKGQ